MNPHVDHLSTQAETTETKPEESNVISPIELKIKAKSLAAEARIIRNLERRLKRRVTEGGKPRPGLTDDRTFSAFQKIRFHRILDVRTESRVTNLARAFLKGHAYMKVEHFTHVYPPMDRVKKMAERYGGGSNSLAVAWKAWEDTAVEHFKATRPKHPAQQAA